MDNPETLTTGGRLIKPSKNNNTPTKKMNNTDHTNKTGMNPGAHTCCRCWNLIIDPN
jgi:hypothetical protein